MRAACPALISSGVTARDQVAEHRVQPAGDLVAGPGQVPVPLGPDLQHGGVIVGGHVPPDLRPQRRDRHRQGVVRVVLVGVPGLQQPHPGGQLRRHIQHLLPGGDQLLGQQVPQPGGAFHRPGPLAARPPPRPAAVPPGMGRHAPAAGPAAPHLCRSPPRYASSCAGRSRSSRPPSAHSPDRCHRTGRPRRACLITVLALAPLSSHTAARPGGLAPRSKARPHNAAGRRIGSQPAGPPERYGSTAALLRFN